MKSLKLHGPLITDIKAVDIKTLVAEKAFNYLKVPVRRLASPDIPTPASYVLEAKFYPGKNEIINCVREMVKK